MTIRLSVDRFEGEKKQLAVLLADDGTQVNFPRAMLPRGVKPGDLLTLSVEKDPRATARLADRARDIQADLKKADDGGDVKI